MPNFPIPEIFKNIKFALALTITISCLGSLVQAQNSVSPNRPAEEESSPITDSADPVGNAFADGSSGDPGKAQSAATSAKKRFHGSATRRTNYAAHYLRQAQVFMNNKQYLEARSVCEKACALDPNKNSANAHTYLGKALASLGFMEEAIVENEKALEYNPKLSGPILNIAGCYQQEGKIDQAILYLKKYVTDNPKAPQYSFATNLIKFLSAADRSVDISANNDYLSSIASNGLVRWPTDRLPLKIYIDSPTGLKGFQQSYSQMLVDSFDQWCQSTSGTLKWTRVTNQADADIVCTWTSDPKDLADSSGNAGVELGVTHVQIADLENSARALDKATIKISTIRASTAKVLSDEDVRFTCLHEVGHALGIQGHSSNNQDVMFFSSRAFPIMSLSPRDKATLSRLYSVVPPAEATRQIPVLF